MRARPASLMALPVLVLLVLGACGGSSGPLTTQEYADALVEARAELEEALQELPSFSELAQDLEGALLSERPNVRSTVEMGNIADVTINFVSEAHGERLEPLKNYRDDLEGLHPPLHLAGLHDGVLHHLEVSIGNIETRLSDFDDIDTGSLDTREAYLGAMQALGDVEVRIGQAYGPLKDVGTTCRGLAEALQTELGVPMDVCPSFDDLVEELGYG